MLVSRGDLIEVTQPYCTLTNMQVPGLSHFSVDYKVPGQP
jgi:hypothetical protein